MGRKIQGISKKGSQKWIQRLINQKPEIMNSQIRTVLSFSENQSITWLSPIADDEYAEYQDKAFLDLLGLELSKMPLNEFWPSGGPCWDGLGRSDTGTIFLVEAKSHIPEILSSGTRAGEKSLKKIKWSLDSLKKFLNSKSDHDWTSTFYQYTN